MIVKYAIQYSTFELTDAEFRIVKRLYETANRVDAVKFIRDQYKLSLKEAKDICDAVSTGFYQ